MGAGGAGHAYNQHDEAHQLYPTQQYQQQYGYGHPDDDHDDSWQTNAVAQYNASRDRYLSRKEAQMAAGAGAAGAAGMGGIASANTSRFSLAFVGGKEKAETGYTYDDAGAYTYGNNGEPGARKSRMWWWVGGIGLLVLLIAGVAIGVTMAKSKSHSSSSSSGDKNNKGVTGVTHSDPSDPSKFDLDSRLKQSFYGIAYTPLNAQYPACGDTLEGVIEDIQILSQLTTRIRTYGTDCNVASYVLEAIARTKVNMTVALGVWVAEDQVVNARQVSELQKAIAQFGVDHVEGVTVGNEWLLNGGTSADLVQKMADMRTLLAGMNLPRVIPVGTADAGSMITADLAAGADYIQANVHAWFGEVPIDQAAGWTWDYAMTNTPSVVLTAANAPKYYIAEVGWPSGANATDFLTLGPATAGIPQLNQMLETYVCAANLNASSNALATNPGYYWFEAFDEPWKDTLYGGVEGYWGLFRADKTLKPGLILPDCPHP